ncbi:SDR family NAD(P)-dependent oxidoreductase [Virgibacillus dokdonensis]|uniref:SDR family NAD(P)-dependent oxidoreductase n=1 Tax=Virgibacillus dokdonensis TaxID=302167 RepID=UPI00098B64E5|nr:SDR family oxidoreductase [Virgibacillus dokdonensis]
MNDFSFDFKGKTALVTGGTRGIGEQLVYDLVESGCNVIFTYSQSKSKAIEMVLELTKTTAVSIRCLKVDFTKNTEIDELMIFLKSIDKIDFLVNNVGVIHDKPLMYLSNSDWNNVLAVNLTIPFILSRELSRKLAVNKGAIVNLSSISGVMGKEGQSNYAASKAGIIGFTKSISKELGPMGVRVNSVAPGYILTEMTEDKIKDRVIKEISLRRIGHTHEISSIIMFLLSSASSYITGKVIVPDGGII